MMPHSNVILWTPGTSLADVEKQVILKAMNYCRDKKPEAANMLKIKVRELEKKIELYENEQKIHDEKEKAEKQKRIDFNQKARGIVLNNGTDNRA